MCSRDAASVLRWDVVATWLPAVWAVYSCGRAVAGQEAAQK